MRQELDQSLSDGLHGDNMTNKQARKLQVGDEVFWTDPDHGLCSRIIKIKSIEFWGDMIAIDGVDEELECFACELS